MEVAANLDRARTRHKPDVPAFEKLEKERLAAAQRSIDQILAVKGPHTIENTLVPQYNIAGYLSVLLQQVHPDAATAMTSKVGAAGAAPGWRYAAAFASRN